MISSGVDGRHAVRAGRKTARNISREHTVNSSIVEALKELERGGVGGRGLGDVLELLDDDVRVTLNLTLAVRNLRRGKEVGRRVHEEARIEVLDCHLDREVRVCLDRCKVGREDEFRRGHRRSRRDHTHRGGIT